MYVLLPLVDALVVSVDMCIVCKHLPVGLRQNKENWRSLSSKRSKTSTGENTAVATVV